MAPTDIITLYSLDKYSKKWKYVHFILILIFLDGNTIIADKSDFQHLRVYSDFETRQKRQVVFGGKYG